MKQIEINPQMRQIMERIAKRADPAWRRSPEGIVDSLNQVQRFEQRHRQAIETMPDVHPEVRVRHAIYAELLQIHREQGDEAFITAYEDRAPGGLWERLQTSFDATTECQKVDGQGDDNKGGHYERHQSLDVMMPGFIPLPATPVPQTYQQYLDGFEAEKQKDIQRVEQMRDMVGKRRKGAFNVQLLEVQASTPLLEQVWQQYRKDQQIREMVAGMLSARNRREQMNLLASRLDWIITKVRSRRYDSLKALCKDFKMPLLWGRAVKAFVVGTGRMSEQEWSSCLGIKRGRPAAPKRRGPYRKRFD